MTFEQYFIDTNTLLTVLTELFDIIASSERAHLHSKIAHSCEAERIQTSYTPQKISASAGSNTEVFSHQKQSFDYGFRDESPKLLHADNTHADAFSHSNKNNIIQALESCLKIQLSSHSGGLYDI